MRPLLFCAIAIATSSAIPCPANYDLQEGIGCVRILYDEVADTVENLLHKAHSECAKDGAHLPIIRTKEVDDHFNDFVNSLPIAKAIWMVLDLTCNTATHRLEWVDGTTPTFPQYFDHDFDCVLTNLTYASQPLGPGWFKAGMSELRFFTVLCVNDGAEIITVAPAEVITVPQASVKPTTPMPICASNYQLQEGIGCVRILYDQVADTVQNLLPKARSECAKDGAHLPIIRNEEVDDHFNDFVNSLPIAKAIWMVLDLTCNTATHRLEWVDGTAPTFPQYFDHDFDCVLTNLTYASQPLGPGWFKAGLSDLRFFNVLCVNDGAEIITVPPTTMEPAPTSPLCFPNYQMQEGIGCVRILYDQVVDTLDNMLPKARSECAKDGAHLPIIRTGEVDDKFNDFVNSLPIAKAIWMVLDLACNTTTHRLEWVDGTALTFPGYFDYDFDCVLTNQTYASQPIMPGWFKAGMSELRFYNVLCVNDGAGIITVQPTTVKPTTASPLCPPNYQLQDGIGCVRILHDSVYDTPDNLLNQARTECAKDRAHLPIIKNQQMDDYFNMFVNNTIHDAGAYLLLDLICNASTRNLQWVDGSSISYPTYLIHPNNYLNFDCAYKENTFASKPSKQQWESIHSPWEHQSTVLCVFDVDQVVTEPTVTPAKTTRPTADVSTSICPQDAPKEGEEILPPGYPDSVVPCQYFLFVAENTRVELEILTLHTGADSEYLEIYESSTGSNLIANLTGTIAAPAKFTTAKSNVMRVSWNPNGAGMGQGFKIRYNAVVDGSASQTSVSRPITTTSGARYGSLMMTVLLAFVILF